MASAMGALTRAAHAPSAADDALCSVMLLYAAASESVAVRSVVAPALLSTMCVATAPRAAAVL